MKKRVFALLLAAVLIMSFSVTAFADPSYSPDGVTCTGDGCHGNASQQQSPAPTPAPAPVVEEEPAEEPAEAEDVDHTQAAEAMAEIVMEELFPETTEKTEEEGSLFQLLVNLFRSFMALIEYLVK